MTPEGFVIFALFFLATGGIALAGFVMERAGLDEAAARWFERRLK